MTSNFIKNIQLIALLVCLGNFTSAKEIHVAKWGDNLNPGTKKLPLNSIQSAAEIALPGDEIIVHKGVYREYINPIHSGLPNKPITYRAAKNEKVVIKGSEVIKDWEHQTNGTWKVILPNTFFGTYNPYNTEVEGEWYKTPADGFNRHTGSVYLNEEWLTEVPHKGKVLSTSSDTLYWVTEVDNNNTTIWAQFGNLNPNEELVEINVRKCVFYPEKKGINYITVQGFHMSQAATPWSGAMSEQFGLIGTHWSKGWVIEDNTIRHSMNTGITLGRYALNVEEMPDATAEGYVESINMALEKNWSKEYIGSHKIINNTISDCEKNGIHGSLGAVFCTIEGNTIFNIGTQNWISGPDVAGLKILAPIDVLIKNNHIHNCQGYGGIWLDWMTQGTRVTGNLMHHNYRDLFVEVNHGPFLIDNNIFLSEIGVLESSGGGAYVHNLFASKFLLRKEPERETPYHKIHSTEVIGLSKVLGDDERFFNNMFIGYTGLSGYNKWKTKHLNSKGNLYLKGALPCSSDQMACVDSSNRAEVKLVQKNKDWWLELDLTDVNLNSIKREIIDSSHLGETIVSKLPFTDTDGSPYLLTKDFLLKKRQLNPTPGPFELKAGKKRKLKVWSY